MAVPPHETPEATAPPSPAPATVPGEGQGEDGEPRPLPPLGAARPVRGPPATLPRTLSCGRAQGDPLLSR